MGSQFIWDFFHPTSHFCLLIWSETASFRKRHFMMLFSKSPRLLFFFFLAKSILLPLHSQLYIYTYIYNIYIVRAEIMFFFGTP